MAEDARQRKKQDPAPANIETGGAESLVHPGPQARRPGPVCPRQGAMVAVPEGEQARPIIGEQTEGTVDLGQFVQIEEKIRDPVGQSVPRRAKADMRHLTRIKGRNKTVAPRPLSS